MSIHVHVYRKQCAVTLIQRVQYSKDRLGAETISALQQTHRSWTHCRTATACRTLRSIKALSHGTRQSRESSSFSMGVMRKAANRRRFCWRRGGGAQAVLVHPKSCRFHEHGASRQVPPKINIFYLFVSGSGSRVGFNQSEN